MSRFYTFTVFTLTATYRVSAFGSSYSDARKQVNGHRPPLSVMFLWGVE